MRKKKIKYIKSIFIFLSFIYLSILFTGCSKIMIGPGLSDYSYHLSGEYSILKNGNERPEIAVLYQEYKDAVPSLVNGIAWDDQYILASQIQDKETHYWIIDVNKENVIGPLTKAEFDIKRNEYRINKNLILKSPEKYKYLDKSQE